MAAKKKSAKRSKKSARGKKPAKRKTKKTRAAASRSTSAKTKKTKKAKRAAPKRKKAVAKTAKPKKASAPKKKKAEFGEGNYKATREFDTAQQAFVAKNRDKIPEMGRAAEEALDGPEGADLEAAEQETLKHAHG